MAQKQKTIRFNKDADVIIAQISPNGTKPNYNYSVNQIFHRYAVLVKHLKPEFKQNEWQAICQAYNGKPFNADIELEAKAFRWQIKEAIKYDENVRTLLDKEVGDPLITDFPEFIAKIEKLEIPQIISVFQVVHEFWTPKTKTND